WGNDERPRGARAIILGNDRAASGRRIGPWQRRNRARSPAHPGTHGRAARRSTQQPKLLAVSSHCIGDAGGADLRALVLLRLAGMQVVDAHVHIFPEEIVRHRDRFTARDRWFEELYAPERARLATAEDLVESMDGA